MAKYRKKPVVVEAEQITERMRTGLEPLPRCVGRSMSGGKLSIATLEGIMTVEVGDWIIKGVKGEFYPCKPDIFEQTYEEV